MLAQAFSQCHPTTKGKYHHGGEVCELVGQYHHGDNKMMKRHHGDSAFKHSSHVCVWFVQTIGDVQEDSVNYVISIVLVLGAFQKDVGSHSKELTEHVETALSPLSRKA